jgi:hypothetical protein
MAPPKRRASAKQPKARATKRVKPTEEIRSRNAARRHKSRWASNPCAIRLTRSAAARLSSGITQRTRDTYDCHVRNVLAWGFEASVPGFIDYMDCETTPMYAHGTYKAMATAIYDLEMSRGNDVSDPVKNMVRRIIAWRAARNANKAPKVEKVRGTVTRARLAELLSKCRHLFTNEDMMGMIAQWSFALRVGEVKRLTRANTAVQDGCWSCFFPRVKNGGTPAALASRPEVHAMLPGYEQQFEKLRELIGARAPDARLFPNYSGTRINRALKLAAKHLGWREDAFWHSHSLRFGGAYTMWRETPAHWSEERRNAAVRAATAHKSYTMAAYYATLEDQRLKDVRLKAQRIAKKCAKPSGVLLASLKHAKKHAKKKK